MLEVEQKFRLVDPETLVQRLQQWPLEEHGTEIQRDTYFNHPSRDFAVTDEALRIRTVDEQNFLTYKGPLLDALTKTREEIETPLGTGAEVREKFAASLLKLGFQAVRDVRKRRRRWLLNWQGRSWEIAWDDVDELGTFLEIETLATEQELDAARALLLQLSEEFQLGAPERRSYLRLLLEQTRP